MPAGGLGSFAVRSGFTSGSVYTYGTLTAGRIASDGIGYLDIEGIYGAISGRGGSRTVTMYCGGSSVDTVRAAAGSAVDTGYLDSNNWIAQSGTVVQYGYTGLSGSCYFARGGAGTSYGAFGNFDGLLGMYYDFTQVPSAPGIAAVVPSLDGESATVTLTGAADHGGYSVSGYRVQRARDAAFTSDVATVSAAGLTGIIMGGLEPGVAYYYRATARNAITNALNILGGTWSSTMLAVQPGSGIGIIRSGATWVTLQGLIRNPANSDWVNLDGLIRSADNSVWLELGAGV